MGELFERISAIITIVSKLSSSQTVFVTINLLKMDTGASQPIRI
jgi:hypothetical protein